MDYRNFQIFNLGFYLTHQIGTIPRPSFPALCHDDTTFHGGPDDGEAPSCDINKRMMRQVFVTPALRVSEKRNAGK